MIGHYTVTVLKEKKREKQKEKQCNMIFNCTQNIFAILTRKNYNFHHAFQPLILGKTDTQSLCKNITHKIYGEKERAVADYWNTYLCSRQMVDRFEQLPLGSIYQDSMTQVKNFQPHF